MNRAPLVLLFLGFRGCRTHLLGSEFLDGIPEVRRGEVGVTLVAVMSWWPGRSFTTWIATPAWTSREAKVCLRSWNLKFRILAFRNAFLQARSTLRTASFTSGSRRRVRLLGRAHAHARKS